MKATWICLLLAALAAIITVSSSALADSPEYIIRDPVEKFDDGYRATIYFRYDKQDYQLGDRPVAVLPADTRVTGVRLKITLPYRILFLYFTNEGEHPLDWWVNLDTKSTGSTIDQLRAEIRSAYSTRTNLTPDTDFVARQLNQTAFQFQVESVSLDPTTRALAKFRPAANKMLALRMALPQAANAYAGFHGDIADDPLIHSNTHIDSLTPPKIGSTRDLFISQMWTDRRGNYVAVIGSDDMVTSTTLTGRHPLFFGNLDRPDMYQFYSKREQSKQMNCRYSELKLDVFSSVPEDLDRMVTVHLDKSGALHVKSSNISSCLREASSQERTILTNRLRNGTVTLHSMPETRHVIYIYKLEGANTFIYVDAAILSRSPESYRMFIGAPGHLQPVDVLQVESIDGLPGARYEGGAIIHTSLGTLYAMTKGGSSYRPFWETTSGKIFLDRITFKQASKLVHFLKQLGVDLNRLREKPYTSPCNYLLRKQPVLRLVS